MGKIALTTLRVLNDRVYHYTAWQYEVSSELKCTKLCTCPVCQRSGDLIQCNPAYSASEIMAVQCTLYICINGVGVSTAMIYCKRLGFRVHLCSSVFV